MALINLNSLPGFEALSLDPEDTMLLKISAFWNRETGERYWSETVETTSRRLGDEVVAATREVENYYLIHVYGRCVDIHVGYLTKLCAYLQIRCPVDEVFAFMERIPLGDHACKEKNQKAAKEIAKMAIKTPWRDSRRNHLVSLWQVLTISI